MKSNQHLACIALCAVASGVAAQSYPVKPIRMIVPWPPGGATDIFARTLSEPLSRALGQTVIVDNRGGSNGIIGAEAVARAAPDGYTTMFHITTSHVTNTVVYKKLNYDTLNDFAPITRITWTPMVIVLHPAFPPKTVAELVTLAKSRPGQVDYASFGIGSMSHLAGELLNGMAHVRMTHVPYKGGAAALIDTIAGHVPLNFAGLTPAQPHINAGKLRALAVTGQVRSKQLPDVPTVASTRGLDGYEATNTFATWAPGKTPPEIVTRLNNAIVKVIQTPDFKQRLEREGASEPIGDTPEQMAAAVRADMAKLTKLVKAAGVEPQ